MTRSARLGVLAMIILAGHPQYIYYTGIVTAMYTAVLMVRSKNRLALGFGYVIIFAGASALFWYLGDRHAMESCQHECLYW